MEKKLKKTVKKLPDAPGVYIFKSLQDDTLYVGKASSLKKRVGSYFSAGRKDKKTKQLVSRIEKIEYIISSSEAEALLMENSLIKSEKPKYNVMYRDDKSYPIVEITAEKFPRIFISRNILGKSFAYFGPFTNARLLKEALSYLRKIVPYRTCKNMPKRACIDYEMGLCPAPCENKITVKEYKKLMDKIILYLKGHKGQLIKKLTKEMYELSKQEKFEQALIVRDKIKAFTSIKKNTGSDLSAGFLYGIKKRLNLKNIPYLIEAFDISSFSGKEAVGSMVVFLGGKPLNKEYRHFRIKNIPLSSDGRIFNDYKMMKEVILRRYRRLVKEKKEMPSLVAVDGGKGHLAVAEECFKKLNIKNMDILAIAKKFDYIYHRENGIIKEYRLEGESLHLFQRVRDQSHRFAKNYHKILRNKAFIKSELDRIRGIGPQKKKDLLAYFKDVNGIKKASKTELLKINGINSKTADKILNYFEESKS